LEAYYRDYARLAESDPESLNRKVPREAFQDLLNHIGSLLLEQSAALATQPGPVRDFLEANPLPTALIGRLPDEFRAFSLVLNALKQWVVAEQAATDRYLLGSAARAECRAAAQAFILSGVPLDNVELHHPVRDGRPPIPLSKLAHAQLEGATLLAIKRGSNRSWVHLRRGCLDLLGEAVEHSTPKVGASSRTFARKAADATGFDCRELLEWLEQNGLGYP
jgi:hypothetical protein